VLWSDLYDQPERLEVELSKYGITPRVLKADVRDVPELRERCKILKGPARLRLALEWFGDRRYPQPVERTVWPTFGRTPDWGRLHRLDDEPGGEGGRPKGSFVETETFWAVWTMAINGESARGVAKRTDPKQAHAEAGLEFVNREKAGVIVKAVKTDVVAARRLLAGRKTPPGFSASPGGIELPMPQRT
jgi:hypothetical protein